MFETDILVFLGVILFFAYMVQAMSGFGAVVLAVTVGALMIPIRQLPPIVVPLNVGLVLYLVLRYRKTIDTRVLFLRILPVMGLGAVLGLLGYEFLPKDFDLKKAFAGLIMVLSLLELIRLLKRLNRVPGVDLIPGPVWIFLAGITHGLWASGGPLLVYAVNRMPLDKASFRSTLSAVWLSLNSGMTVYYLAAGHLTGERLVELAIFLPAVVAGTVLGEILHHKVPEYHFRISVSLILLFAGGALFFR